MQIRYQRVKNGCSSDQQNKEEAKVIAQAVREHFQKHPNETLGVAAMSAKQRDQIENEIEVLAKKDDLFADQLDKDAKKSEPLFVKNLEDVQGDKRDVIFISITYGPKQPGGKVYQRFGPINSEHGWRRLNVLFTRSKKRMRVFSSMDSGDILVGQDTKRGVRDLRDFLKYCETGELAMVNKSDIKKMTENVLIDNTAQSVLNHLKALESSRAHVRTRWVWELLQNARDASLNSDRKLVASIVQREDEIVFRHNGDNFKLNEVIHLIYHGSTKVESEETIGQYGSGFLTTHLLSPEIKVSGRLDDNRNFSFRLKRELGSVKELSDSMRNAAKDFASSLSNSPANDSFTTEFRYPLRDDAFDVVSEGIAKLKQCAPFIAAFNRQFATINIESPGEIVMFNVIGRTLLQQSGIEQITVSETINGSAKVRQYLIAHGDKLSVAIPLESVDDGQVCLPVEDTPRLFLGFPLIGTENFSFPAVINSFRFTPTENRDGVFLWQAEDAANLENQSIVEEACQLLVEMLQFVATSGWRDAYHLANIPAIQGQSWMDPDKLRECLKTLLVERIRQTPAILSQNGAIDPNKALVPFTEQEFGTEGVESFWDLLDSLKEFQQKLILRDEVVGWRDAVESWPNILGGKVTDLPEVIDGSKLAIHIEEATRDADETYGHLNRLQLLLKEGVDAVEWLNQLCGFLKTNGFDNVIRTRSIILNQSGCLDKLSNLHRDSGISEELKDIATSLEWNIRGELRDTRITALAKEIGKGDWDDDHVVRECIKQLQERAEQNPDAAFTEASVSLFTWIAGQKKWDLLRGFPVFSNDSLPAQWRVIKLERDVDDDLRPLAPVSAWPPKLQDFHKLFPSRYTLANAFSEDVSDPKVWEVLEADGFVRRNVIITKKVCLDFETFLPDELLTDGDHKTSGDVSITDVAFITGDDIGIMARVRQSQRLACLFWRFLTEWMTKHDSDGLKISEALCNCGETHRYYPAKWLIPVSGNKWVPFSAEGSKSARKATAQSLAELLRGSEWTPDALDDNPAAVKLLEAIGVTRFDLTRSFMASTDEERAEQEKEFTRILTSTGGNLKPVSEFAEDLKDDPELPEYLAKRRKNKQIVRDNQCLGKRVEKWVKELVEERLNKNRLKGEEFTVRNTGVGSDLAIEEYDLATLEINKSGRRWLVEVKATRGQEVRMTATQAKTAVREFQEKKRFFLCVVPVSGETTDLADSDVRDKMRFVPDIGARLVDLCKNLDSLQNQRNKITGGDSNGVQLKVEDGAAWVRIASSVWQNEGFPLDELPDHLN